MTNGRNRGRLLRKERFWARQCPGELGKFRHSIAPALSRQRQVYGKCFSAHALLHTCLTGEEYAVLGFFYLTASPLLPQM